MPTARHFVGRDAERFADFHGQERPEPQEEEDYTDPRHDRILYLHVDALLQVIGRDDEDDPPLARILSRERATWHRAFVSQGIATDPVPDRLYPSPPGPDARWIEPLEPDLLDEELVRQVLTEDVGLLDQLLDIADDRHEQDALVVVGRLLEDRPPPGLARSIYGRIGAENHLPVSLRETAEAATRLVLEQHREDHPEHDEKALAERSRLLNNLSVCLGDLGRHEEALSAIEQAVEIDRDLARCQSTGLPSRPGAEPQQSEQPSCGSRPPRGGFVCDRGVCGDASRAG